LKKPNPKNKQYQLRFEILYVSCFILIIIWTSYQVNIIIILMVMFRLLYMAFETEHRLNLILDYYRERDELILKLSLFSENMKGTQQNLLLVFSCSKKICLAWLYEPKWKLSINPSISIHRILLASLPEIFWFLCLSLTKV